MLIVKSVSWFIAAKYPQAIVREIATIILIAIFMIKRQGILINL